MFKNLLNKAKEKTSLRPVNPLKAGEKLRELKLEKFHKELEPHFVDEEYKSLMWKERYLDLFYTTLAGVSAEEPVFINLITAPNVLISGKEETLRRTLIDTMLLSLLFKNSSQNIELYFMDNSGYYKKYYQFPHTKGYASNNDEIASMIELLFAEINHRHSIMRHYNMPKNVSNIGFNHYALVIDDLSMVQDLDLDDKVMEHFEKIVSVGDRFGIHCILNTCNNSKDIIDENLLNQYHTRIAFRVDEEEESNFLLKKSGAELIEKDDQAIMLHIFEKKGRDDDSPDEYTNISVYKMGEEQVQHIYQMQTPNQNILSAEE